MNVRSTNAPLAAIEARLAPKVNFGGARPGLQDLPALSAVLATLVGGLVLFGWWLGVDAPSKPAALE